MKIMRIIGYIIDLVALFIQLPYMFIAGAIVGESYVPYFGSNAVYIWYPTDGVLKMWMRPCGDIAFDIITYKELFR